MTKPRQRAENVFNDWSMTSLESEERGDCKVAANQGWRAASLVNGEEPSPISRTNSKFESCDGPVGVASPTPVAPQFKNVESAVGHPL